MITIKLSERNYNQFCFLLNTSPTKYPQNISASNNLFIECYIALWSAIVTKKNEIMSLRHLLLLSSFILDNFEFWKFQLHKIFYSFVLLFIR